MNSINEKERHRKHRQRNRIAKTLEKGEFRMRRVETKRNIFTHNNKYDILKELDQNEED